MRRILRAEYQQVHLLPPAVEDWLPAGHPARFVREFVETLKLGAMGFEEPNAEEGGVCYAPELLLSVWLYGYWRKVRSTRRLEEACVNDLGFIWLSGTHRPDHNALWRFWQANRPALKALFRRTVRVAMKAGLVEMVTQAIDGTKIMAACSHWGKNDAAHHQHTLAKLDQVIAELEEQIAAVPPEGPRAAELKLDLQSETGLRAKVRAAAAAIEAEESKHIHPQEPEARRMKTPGRNHFAYNGQVATDAAHSVITAAEVVQDANDHGQLAPMMKAALETTTQAPRETLADAGYSSAAQIAAAQALGSTLYLPLARPVQNAEAKPYHESNFRFVAERDLVVCPQGRELKFHRERPAQTGHLAGRVYRGGGACAGCPVRRACTKDRHGRSILITPERAHVQAHRAHMARPESEAIASRRGSIVERVFGQIKGHWGFTRWTVKGLENVRAQWSLLCSTWNLTRLYQHWLRQPGLVREAMAAGTSAGAS
jgi:transposase